MKIAKILFAGLLALFALTGCIKDKNAIIKVNDEAITQAQYDEVYKMETSSPQYQMFASLMKDDSNFMELMLKERIVNDLVTKKVLEQEIAKREITVTDEEVQAKKAEIIEKIGGADKLDEALKKNNIDNKKFEADLREEVKIEKLVQSLGTSNITDKEVKKFYTENKESFNYPERVRASHILIEVNPQKIKQDIISQDKKGEMTSEDINKKTQEILDEKMNLAKEVRAKAAKDPKNFAALAKQYSEDKGSAEKGGDLGFFDRSAMVKPFSDAAFKLKPGTVSEIVTSDFGHHIILVVDKAKAGIQPYEKVKDEISAFLKQQKQINMLKNFVEGLKASAKIEYLKPEYDLNEIQKQIKEETEKKAKEATKNTTPKTIQKAPAAPAEKTKAPAAPVEKTKAPAANSVPSATEPVKETAKKAPASNTAKTPMTPKN